MNLRPYQQKSVEETLTSLNRCGRTLTQLPTGGGKTIVFASVVQSYMKAGKRVLILAHREELIMQAAQKLYSGFGIYSGLIMAGQKESYALPVQVASIATYKNRRKFPADVVIIDEAHHATAASYRTVLENHMDALIWGLTATPYRLSGEGFTDIFKELVTGPTVKELEESKYLCNADVYVTPIEAAKMDSIKITAGDYNEAQMAELMSDAVQLQTLIESYRNYCYGKRAIIFAVNIEHSKKMVDALNKAGVPSAHVDGSSQDRARIFKKFEAGEILCLSNVGIATEGTDIPAIEAVIGARPTKSLSLYLQMCGRGSRPLPGKEKYVYLDLANNMFEHGSPNEDHNWHTHFAGTRKPGERKEKAQPKQFRIKFPNGAEMIGTFRDIPAGVKGLKLEPITEPIRLHIFSHHAKVAAQRGWMPGSAYHRFIEELRKMGQKPNATELRIIAKQLNYSQGWVYHKCKEFGI